MKLISFKELVTFVAILGLLFVAMFITLKNFEGESHAIAQSISDPKAKADNNIEIQMRLVTIDPIKGEASARMEFSPHGHFVNANQELNRDIKVFIPTANGKTDVEYKKGKHMSPVDVSFSLYNGNAADYPFDSHDMLIELYADATGDGQAEAVPLDITFSGSVPGYHVEVEKTKESQALFTQATVEVSRSAAVTVFSCFIMFVMWALAISVLLMLLTVLFRKQKIEIAMYGFMSTLLFAFYALRNGQPNVPPIGVFSDVVSFFWAEILVGGCLIVSVFAFIFRKPNA